MDSLDANAMRTTNGLYYDGGYWSDPASSIVTVGSSTVELNRYRTGSDYSGSSISPHMPRSASASTFSQYSASPIRVRRASGSSKKSKGLIMDDSDKGIYNSLGSSSSPRGKVLFAGCARCCLHVFLHDQYHMCTVAS